MVKIEVISTKGVRGANQAAEKKLGSLYSTLAIYTNSSKKKTSEKKSCA